MDPSGVVIPFEDGHVRQLPFITQGPFEYSNYAVSFLKKAIEAAEELRLPSKYKFKQAVISASAMSLLYPSEEIVGYPREEFLNDVVRCATKDIRLCLDAGAEIVQVDFTEGRLSLKLDGSGKLLNDLIAINERVFSSFSDEDKLKIGIHVCPGADQDCCHRFVVM